MSARCRRLPRHRLGGAARRPRRPDSGPAEAALPARARRQAAGRGANRPAMRLSRPVHPSACAHASRPSAPRPRARLAAIHASAFARPWSTLDFERLLGERGRRGRRALPRARGEARRLRPVADRARRGGDPHGRHRPGGARAGPCARRSSPTISTRSPAGASPACIWRSRRATRRRSRSTAASLREDRAAGRAITASPTGRGSRR